ncbi:GNAT family N-acetyltransferase [Legionella steigerwaltii]|nr:GNAT family N-acetyltransferase [Legionella steigerwaltii]
MHHFISIETARLMLRKPNQLDFLSLANLWKNETVRKHLGGVVNDNIINERINSIQNHWHSTGFGLCTVLRKNTTQIIGICGLHHSDEGIEISYMFFPKWWGQGFAYEAITASLNYGFVHLNIGKIIAITQEANSRSCYLLEKVGMRCVDTFIRYDAQQCLYELLNNQDTSKVLKSVMVNNG